MQMRAFELQQMARAKNATLARLGLEDLDTRKREYTLARGAFVNAYRHKATLMELGKIIGKDHSTVIHAIREHGARLNYKDYRWAYKVACEIREEYPIETAESVDSKSLEDEIKKLNDMVSELVKYKELYLTLKKTFDEF
jgi:ribosomal protein L30E